MGLLLACMKTGRSTRRKAVVALAFVSLALSAAPVVGLLLVSVTASSSRAAPAPGAFDPANPAASGYALVFDDEFNSASTIDVNNTKAPGFKWYPGNFFGGATPASYIQVSGGELQLL